MEAVFRDPDAVALFTAACKEYAHAVQGADGHKAIFALAMRGARSRLAAGRVGADRVGPIQPAGARRLGHPTSGAISSTNSIARGIGLTRLRARPGKRR